MLSLQKAIQEGIKLAADFFIWGSGIYGKAVCQLCPRLQFLNGFQILVKTAATMDAKGHDGLARKISLLQI